MQINVQDLGRYNPPRVKEKVSLRLFIFSLKRMARLDFGLKEFIKVMGSIPYFLEKNNVFSCFLEE
jgi:hypothetical protein